MPKLGIKPLIMALFVSMLFMVVMGGMTLSILGIEFRVSFALSEQGVTEIIIPPVGSITAKTHLTPIKIQLILQNINIEMLQSLIEEAPLSSELAQDIKRELQDIALVFMLHLFLIAAAGGMIGAILISGKRMKPAIYGAIAGVLLCLLLVVTTQTSYQTEKLRTPEYHGALKAAPWAIDMAEKAFQKFNLLGEQMQIIATNLYKIFEQIDRAAPLKQEYDSLLVLHVSDIHNNPAAHKFIQQIVNSFPVDIVIDTGDITDYGTPIESQLLVGLKDMKTTYLFIPGNHDSPQTINDLSAYPQVQVLTGGIVDVQGLRILTIADPASSSTAITINDQAIISETKAQLRVFWEEALNKPNIIAVHNYILAEDLVGEVPLILFGHTHQYTIREEKGTVLINAGTTGSAGLRGLQATKEIPYSVVLLHFRRDENNELVLSATDTIKVYNMETGFILERKLFSS
ncbi:MAG: hypothetical protein CVU87_03630 [Firmicutes bacterium HGW-Firmicutes-12]|jgi:predicted phosphodiesterase|nr:MAG: hypothetical protein CVU87_03630 [Firmicutes bacterium HGW-Firmicutes-12]